MVSILLAAGGGCLLMLGNLSMQRALIMGVPLAIVLPMQGSLTVVLGTSINYLLQPGKSHAPMLACGVAAFLLAILLSASAHLAHERDSAGRRDYWRRRRRRFNHSSCCGRADELLITASCHSATCGTPSTAPAEIAASTTTVSSDAPAALVGVTSPDAPAPTPLPPPRCATAVTGLAVAALGGFCFGFFSPAFNLAVNDELRWIARSGGTPLSVPAANWWFCLAFALSAWVVNLCLMRWPPPGAESTSPRLCALAVGNDRGLAALAGCVCALGNAAQFWGGKLAGFAAADLVQAFPLVGTLWGIGCLGEFRGASVRVRWLLAAMYGAFIGAVVLLVASVREEPS